MLAKLLSDFSVGLQEYPHNGYDSHVDVEAPERQHREPWARPKIALAVVATLTCIYWLLSTFLETGQVHYQIHKAELHQIVKAAQAVSMTPGLIYPMTYSNGQLEVKEDGEITLLCHRGTARRYVIIKRDGAFGQQGYIYAQDPSVNHINVDGFPYHENHSYVKVDAQWWGYQSLKP